MKNTLLILLLCLLGFIQNILAQHLPLKSTRTISFTTSEGSYMNVDVSPDGKTLVFDLLGDLYTIPTVGGKAIQLTRGMAVNVDPIWSQDGKRIAYISDATGSLHLSVRNITGSFQRTLGTSDNQLDNLQNSRPNILWSAESRYVGINRSLYGLSGGKLTFPVEIKQPISFKQNILYHIDSNRIFRCDLITHINTAISPLLKKYLGGELSPDGRFWAYVSDSVNQRRLIILNLKSFGEIVLISSLGETTPKIYHFSFSQDAKSIFIGYKGKLHRVYISNGADKIIPFIAKVKVDLAPLNYNTFRVTHAPFQLKYIRSANASPDGKQLVFSALNKVWIMRLPNGKPRVLSPQPFNQFQPVFSPDGKWVAYTSWCDSVGGQLWRVRISGGLPEQLTKTPAEYRGPAWSPDGKLITFVKRNVVPDGLDDRSRFQVYGQLEIIRVDTKTTNIISDSVALLNQLTFSNNAKRIIYETLIKNSPFNPQLVSTDLNGGNEHVLFTAKFTDFDPDEIYQRTISPNGHFIVCSMGEDLYLFPLCKGAKPFNLDDASAPGNGLIRFASGVDPHWEKHGKLLSWTYGNRFFQISPEKIIETAEKLAEKRQLRAIPDSGFLTIHPVPERVVNVHITAPTNYAEGVVVLKNARIISMVGDQIFKKGTIVIVNGRFQAVGAAGKIPVPFGAKVIDLEGKTIIPGFVDLHLHMHGPSEEVMPQQKWMYLANLAYGVTTARDPASFYESFGSTELLTSGKMTGPRLYSAGAAVGIDGDSMMKSFSNATSVVKGHKMLGGAFMKQYNLPTRMQREWLVKASRSARLNMTNEGDYDALFDFAMLKDGGSGIEHNPDWGDAYQDVITLFAKSRTWLTPTLQVRPLKGNDLQYFDHKYWHEADPKMKRFMSTNAIGAILNGSPIDTVNSFFLSAAKIDAKIRKAGGKVTLGSHGNNEGIGVHNELWALQMGGLSNMQALQAATIMGAQAIGIQKDVGSIEIGKIADLIILNKNPLEDIHNSREIKYVMKDGILYEGDTLDEIWPVYKKCPDWRVH